MIDDLRRVFFPTPKFSDAGGSERGFPAFIIAARAMTNIYFAFLDGQHGGHAKGRAWWGARAARKALAETAAKIPGAKHVVIPDAGHITALENPDAFYQAIDNFLAGQSE